MSSGISNDTVSNGNVDAINTFRLKTWDYHSAVVVVFVAEALLCNRSRGEANQPPTRHHLNRLDRMSHVPRLPPRTFALSQTIFEYKLASYTTNQEEAAAAQQLMMSWWMEGGRRGGRRRRRSIKLRLNACLLRICRSSEARHGESAGRPRDSPL